MLLFPGLSKKAKGMQSSAIRITELHARKKKLSQHGRKSRRDLAVTAMLRYLMSFIGLSAFSRTPHTCGIILMDVLLCHGLTACLSLPAQYQPKQ